MILQQKSRGKNRMNIEKLIFFLFSMKCPVLGVVKDPTPVKPGRKRAVKRFRSKNMVVFDFFLSVYRLSQPDTQFPNSGAKNAHAMAPCLSLTHPERCATKLCAGKYDNFLGIFPLRPNHYKSVVPKCLKNCPKVLR